MDSMTIPMPPAAFYYYSPDPNAEGRQHGHFLPQQPHQMLYQAMPQLPSTPIYSRPSSSCSQQQMQLHHMKPVTSAPTAMMTPMPSPPAPASAVVRSFSHKPSIMLETELIGVDGMHYPSTPPLSSSSSSPGACDMLATPLHNPMFSCVENGIPETIVGWSSSCTTPPLTPDYIHPQSLKAFPLPKQPVTSVPSDLLSVSPCPSLSPSPSPHPHSLGSELDNDYCDPRNLTVSCSDSLSSELSALSSLEDEYMLKSEPLSAVAQSPESVLSSAALTPFTDGLPVLDEFPDVESEDEFVNGIVNLTDLSASSSVATPASLDLANRSRATSSASTNSDFECDEFFGTWESSFDSECPPSSKRQRTASGSFPIMSATTESSVSSSAQEQQQQQQQSQQQSASNTSEQDEASDSNSASSGSPENSGSNDMSSAPVPTNRRGRKQSLTEDPSKIFACDLCNRRFRRQEHLKRHYRSLHTQEKPFSCHECGKKFSRSDNLAQHARTHGAGAFVMNLYDDPDMVAAATAGYPHAMFAQHPMSTPMGEDYSNMGRVLFQVAADIPGSASELSSDDGSNAQSKKKRKRAE